MTTDGRLLVLGALGLLGAATAARGSKGVVRRSPGAPVLDPWSLLAGEDPEGADSVIYGVVKGTNLPVFTDADSVVKELNLQNVRKYKEEYSASAHDYAAMNAMRDLVSEYWVSDDPDELARGYTRGGRYEKPLHKDVDDVIASLQKWSRFVKKRQAEVIAKRKAWDKAHP
jgi:hypothetical protein